MKVKVILYSTNCPKCKVLEKKLRDIDFIYLETITDEEIMKEKGFMSAPMVEVDNKIMNFSETIKWINSL